MSEKQYIWNDEDVVVDETRKIKKLWDNIVPEMYPHVLKFETYGAKWVTHIAHMGPYHMTEKDLKFSCKATISIIPLMETGFVDVGRPLKLEEFTNAYGKDYDYELRNLMRSLLKHVNIEVSHFDFLGDLSYTLIEPQNL